MQVWRVPLPEIHRLACGPVAENDHRLLAHKQVGVMPHAGHLCAFGAHRNGVTSLPAARQRLGLDLLDACQVSWLASIPSDQQSLDAMPPSVDLTAVRAPHRGGVNKHRKLLRKILEGQSDAGIAFEGLCALLRWLGFDERVRGSHRIFTRADIAEILNVQPVGSRAKPYQVKQVRALLLRYRLEGDHAEH